MSNFMCGCRRSCVTLALIASAVVGVLAAFLTITGAITVAPAALIVAFGIAVAYPWLLLVVFRAPRAAEYSGCLCSAVRASLAGALGTAAAALVLLAFTFAVTSVLGAVVTGVLAAGFTLLLTAAACLAKCLAGCQE
ncbi:MAG: hypothetical protein IJB17_01395 [Oscillospiraceae bacterium]|nr:hypothetical protein [Oscillospiraceae bacterium]